MISGRAVDVRVGGVSLPLISIFGSGPFLIHRRVDTFPPRASIVVQSMASWRPDAKVSASWRCWVGRRKMTWLFFHNVMSGKLTKPTGGAPAKETPPNTNYHTIVVGGERPLEDIKRTCGSEVASLVAFGRDMFGINHQGVSGRFTLG